ncbi:MAG: hypothetical protein OHK0015_28490 [Chloroflexi bacterium OHK40]
MQRYQHRPVVILLALLFVALLTCSSPALAAVNYNIDLEGASIDSNWNLIDSGVTYANNNYDRVNVAKPFLSLFTKTGTGRSLKFEAKPSTAVKHRVENFSIKKTAFDQWKYYGFQFLVHGASGDPTNWTIINQNRQDGNSGSPIGALWFTNGMTLAYDIRNTEYYSYIDGKDVIGPSGSSLNIWQKSISKDVWYDIVIGFRPDGSANGTGRVQIYFNGVLEADWTGNLGFPDDFLGVTNINRTYSNHFGIYRAGQNSTFIYYLDNFKIATSYEEARP